MLKLALYGLSGVGKSTASALLGRICAQRGITSTVVKIAEPLYRAQQYIYTMLSRPIQTGQQDQILLRTLAEQIRRIEPSFLAEDFLRRADHAGAMAVINDDLKDVAFDYPRLVAARFRFVNITCAENVRIRRLHGRVDLSQAPETPATWGFEGIRPDAEIDNTDDGEDELARKVSQLLAGWLP